MARVDLAATLAAVLLIPVITAGCGSVAKAGAKTAGFAAKTASKAAIEAAKAGTKVATAPLRGVRSSSRSGQRGEGGYSYTVRGRRYHVMDPAAARRYREVGIASYYGRRGDKTANGERVNPRALTAAHKSLPFGTRVRVTNLSNGRNVVVRINDRGPFVRGRIIDLTRAGADRLGFRSQGLTRVRVQTVR